MNTTFRNERTRLVIIRCPFPVCLIEINVHLFLNFMPIEIKLKMNMW